MSRDVICSVSNDPTEWLRHDNVELFAVEVFGDDSESHSPAKFYSPADDVDAEAARLSLLMPKGFVRVTWNVVIKATYKAGKRQGPIKDARECFDLSDADYAASKMKDSQYPSPTHCKFV